MGKKSDVSEYGIVAGIRWAGLSISETYTNFFQDYREDIE